MVVLGHHKRAHGGISHSLSRTDRSEETHPDGLKNIKTLKTVMFVILSNKKS